MDQLRRRIRNVARNLKVNYTTRPRSIRINFEKELLKFLPSSGGNFKSRVDLGISTINNIFPFITILFSESLNSKFKNILTIEEFASLKINNETNQQNLKNLFDFYGSDKSSVHNYEIIYASILGDGKNIKKILEIGLGSNNSDVVSNMGSAGRPGASLRAFRDHCSNAMIFGADIDQRVLFTEDRIETFQVNQTDLESLRNLESRFESDFDLVIDDGLHSVDANIATLNFGLKKIRSGGWVVIEDINPLLSDFWVFLGNQFPIGFSTFLIETKSALIFAVQKK